MISVSRHTDTKRQSADCASGPGGNQNPDDDDDDDDAFDGCDDDGEC